jgi:hypothetical protein
MTTLAIRTGAERCRPWGRPGQPQGRAPAPIGSGHKNGQGSVHS